LLQNGILHFVYRFSQSSEIVLESRIYVDEKPKGGLALIGLGLMFIIKNTHKLNKVVKT